MGNRSFYGCDSLTEISIPSRVVKIEYSAFELCRILKNITIPKNVQEIEYSVFDGCSNLGSIIVEEKIQDRIVEITVMQSLKQKQMR